jgi:hypothetical protein
MLVVKFAEVLVFFFSHLPFLFFLVRDLTRFRFVGRSYRGVYKHECLFLFVKYYLLWRSGA